MASSSCRTRFVFLPDLEAAAYWRCLYVQLKNGLHGLCQASLEEDWAWSASASPPLVTSVAASVELQASPSLIRAAEFGGGCSADDLCTEEFYIGSPTSSLASSAFHSCAEDFGVVAHTIDVGSLVKASSILSGPKFGFEHLLADSSPEDEVDDAVDASTGSAALACVSAKQHSGQTAIKALRFPSKRRKSRSFCSSKDMDSSDVSGLGNYPMPIGSLVGSDVHWSKPSSGLPKVPRLCEVCFLSPSCVIDKSGVALCEECCFDVFDDHDSDAGHLPGFADSCDIVCNLCGTFIGLTSSGNGCFCPFCPGTGVSIHDWEDDLDGLQCESCDGPLAAHNLVSMMCDNCLDQTL